MKIDLACLCGERDEIPEPTHEPVICGKCGDRMRVYLPPAWIIESRRRSTPEAKGTARG